MEPLRGEGDPSSLRSLSPSLWPVLADRPPLVVILEPRATIARPCGPCVALHVSRMPDLRRPAPDKCSSARQGLPWSVPGWADVRAAGALGNSANRSSRNCGTLTTSVVVAEANVGRKSRQKRSRRVVPDQAILRPPVQPLEPAETTTEVVTLEALLKAARRAEARARYERRRVAQIVTRARDHGATWADVGRALDISRQGARQRFEGN